MGVRTASHKRYCTGRCRPTKYTHTLSAFVFVFLDSIISKADLITVHGVPHFQSSTPSDRPSKHNFAISKAKKRLRRRCGNFQRHSKRDKKLGRGTILPQNPLHTVQQLYLSLLT